MKRIILYIIATILLILLIAVLYFNSGSSHPDNTVWSHHIGRDTTVGILPDQYANYFSYTSVRTSKNIGYRIKGLYPDTRYFSINVYSLGDNTTQGSIIDYQIESDSGLPNPFNVNKDSVDTGTKYTINLIPDLYDNKQLRNVLSFRSDSRLISIVIRLYDYNIDDLGGVDLPTVEAFSIDTELSDPLVTRRLPRAISLKTIVRNISLPGMVKRLGQVFETEKIAALDQSLANQSGNKIPFHSINTDGYIANNDNRYLLAGITQQDEEVYLFKFKSPSYTTGPNDIHTSQVRYWSFNLGNADTYNFNGLKDEDAIIDRNGYVTIVLAKSNNEVIKKCAEMGFNYMEWNMPWKKGLILFRHMLAQPDWDVQIENVPPLDTRYSNFEDLEAQNYMGDYAPIGQRLPLSDFLKNTPLTY